MAHVPTPGNQPMSPNRTLLDVHEIHEVHALVATSSPSSSSINNSSPTSLTPEPSFHGVHSFLHSSSSTLTVKFAPLPEIDPNRKRSLAPLGVPARSRRIPIVQQDSDGGSLLWSRDLDMPENMEDPLITFARFIKKTSRTLWRRVRKGSVKAAPREDALCSTEPVLDIRSIDCPAGDVMLPTEKGHRVGGENKRGRPASWSPSAECWTLGKGDERERRSTSDLGRPQCFGSALV